MMMMMTFHNHFFPKVVGTWHFHKLQLVMLMSHDGIMTGESCVVIEVVIDEAKASASHTSMVLCRNILVFVKD